MLTSVLKLSSNQLSVTLMEKWSLEYLQQQFPMSCLTWFFKLNFDYDVAFSKEIEVQREKLSVQRGKVNYA